MRSAFCRGRCPHRPNGNHRIRRSVFRFGRAFCRADVGIGPYNARKEVQRTWAV
nr:MAG TPA: hypothetical protein [Caudoviricetes sp.]